MRSIRYLWLSLALAGAATLPHAMGCSSSEQASADDDVDEADEGELPGPSRGSAIVLSADDRVAVMVNRDVGTVSVFSLEYPRDGYSKDGTDSFLPVITNRPPQEPGGGPDPRPARRRTLRGRTNHGRVRADRHRDDALGQAPLRRELGRTPVASRTSSSR